MMCNSLTLDKTVVDAVRAFRPEDNELEDDTNASNKFLGVNTRVRSRILRWILCLT